MISRLKKINQVFYPNTQATRNNKLFIAIRNYKFWYITEKNIFIQNEEIISNLNESKFMIINEYIEPDEKKDNCYFFICYEKTVLIINRNMPSLLNQLFKDNTEYQILFLFNTKNSFDKVIKIQYKQINSNPNLNEEINNFKSLLRINCGPKVFQTWNNIRICISGYLITKSYLKLNANRITNYLSNFNSYNFDEDNFIELGKIGQGSSSKVCLNYKIDGEELMVKNIFKITKQANFLNVN